MSDPNYEHVKRSQCISFAQLRPLKLSFLHSIGFHMLLRISLVSPVFLVHPTTKIWQDFSSFSPSLIFRELWLPFTKLYIFDKLKNVQSIVDKRDWIWVNYFQITGPRRRRRRHRPWASRITWVMHHSWFRIPTLFCKIIAKRFARYETILQRKSFGVPVSAYRDVWALWIPLGSYELNGNSGVQLVRARGIYCSRAAAFRGSFIAFFYSLVEGSNIIARNKIHLSKPGTSSLDLALFTFILRLSEFGTPVPLPLSFHSLSLDHFLSVPLSVTNLFRVLSRPKDCTQLFYSMLLRSLRLSIFSKIRHMTRIIPNQKFHSI